MTTSELRIGSFDRAELALLIGAALFSALITYLIVSDFTLLKGHFDAKGLPIAKVALHANVVKRRPAELPVWNQINSTEDLYQSDQIYTDDDSRVRIRFSTNDEIEVSENALVVIERYEEMASIQVKRGAVIAMAKSASPQVRINVGTSSTFLNKPGTEALIEAVDGEAKVSVYDGQAELRSGKEVRIIERNQEARINQDQTQTIDAEIKLFVPSLGSMNANSKSLRKISWSPVERIDSYLLEISRTSDFAKVVHKVTTQETAEVAPEHLSGLHFVRVGAVKDGAIRYSLRKPVVFNSLESSNPVYTGKNLGVQNTEPVNVAKASFQQDQMPQMVTVSTTPSLPDSRVPSNDGLTLQSVEKVEGYRNDPQKPRDVRDNIWDSLKVHSPNADATFTYRKHLPRINFAWSGLKAADEYEIQVARDENFEDLALNSIIKHPQTSFPLRKGEYHWRVRPKRKQDSGLWTTVRSILVIQNTSIPELTFPPSESEVDFDETERRSLDVTWQNADDLTELVLLVSRDPDLTQIVGRLDVTGRSAKIILQEDGKYFWQIRGVDRKERVVVQSKLNSFNVSTTKISRPKYLEDTFRVEALYTPTHLDYAHKDNTNDKLNFKVAFKRSYQLALRGWFNENWGFEMEFSRKWADAVVKVDAEDVEAQKPFFDIVETGGALKRRWTFWKNSYPVDLGVRFGYLYQPLFTFYKDGESGTYGLVSSDSHNLVLGFETRIPIGGTFNLETKIDYLQLIMSEPIETSKSNHFLVTSTLVGQFFRYLSMSLGGFYRSQSFSYENPSDSSKGSLEAHFLGVLYGLGYVF